MNKIKGYEITVNWLSIPPAAQRSQTNFNKAPLLPLDAFNWKCRQMILVSFKAALLTIAYVKAVQSPHLFVSKSNGDHVQQIKPQTAV